jgi:hypothetical protein
MEELILGFLVVTGFYILYMVIKAAVRNGIREAGLGIDPPSDKNKRITLIPCPSCNKTHAPSLLVCPHCGHDYKKD